MTISKAIVIAALMLGVAACGRSENANDQLAANATTDLNASQTDASNPFANAEQKMSQAMMAAVGPTAGDTWVRMMIAHHQGAIDMSRIALQQNLPADVAKMAQETIDKQQKEVTDLQKLVQQGTPDPKTMDLYHPAMRQMEDAMKNASGADIAETYMRKMLEHHKGGVTLSDVALKNGVTGAIRSQVQKTRAGQQKDSEMVEAMLQGKPMQQAKQEASGSPSETSAATASKGMPVPGTKTPEHVAHDMNNMGNMDMNHM